MVDKAKFLECKFKEIVPLLEVAVVSRENDGNVVGDVEQHEC